MGEDSIYVKPGENGEEALMLVVYSDDLALTGPGVPLHKQWDTLDAIFGFSKKEGTRSCEKWN